MEKKKFSHRSAHENLHGDTHGFAARFRRGCPTKAVTELENALIGSKAGCTLQIPPAGAVFRTAGTGTLHALTSRRHG